MSIPKIENKDIIAALKYIDENEIPNRHQSTRYELKYEGKAYPPKYVIAVANHLANGSEISTNQYNAVEAKNFLENKGFNIMIKDHKNYELIITADDIKSTDSNFTMDNIYLGDMYKPINTYFKNSEGEQISRQYNKRERKNSNQTLPRLAFQVFEDQISKLSDEEKESFPICRYKPQSNLITGIYSSVEDFRKHYNTIEYVVYDFDDGQFVIYCWNIFSTILFVQECLRRFGKPGDQFILIYQEREKDELKEESEEPGRKVESDENFISPFSQTLIDSKNIIFRGAPGTGKSYLARRIATDIISNSSTDDYSKLTEEQKKQIEFVQFHPSYDYTDFVEGLRPRINDDGEMKFVLQDGIFKKFIDRARNNFENSLNSSEDKLNNYVFIIDEINRGEISKIFGELFYTIDPDYRGRNGEISTQYANLHKNPDDKFFIPENVYIIGTMNDIDRSIDSFDFAMRRRFRFIELRADECLEMLGTLNNEKLEAEAIKRMKALNDAISEVEGLNENYHIGPSYFLKLKTITFNQLWTDYLKPLLQDYIQGMYDEDKIMEQFEQAYGYSETPSQTGEVIELT